MGWVRHSLNEIRRLRQKLDGGSLELRLDDGTVERFTLDDFLQNFKRNSERLRSLYMEEEVPPPHPYGAALTRAVDLPPELWRGAQDQRRLDAQIERSLSGEVEG